MTIIQFIKAVYHKYIGWLEKVQKKKYRAQSIALLKREGDEKAMQIMTMHANRYRVLQYYRSHDAGEYASELNFLQNNFPRCMQCSENLDKFEKSFIDEVETVQFDYDKKMYYACYKNRKMYFKRSMTKDVVIQYYTTTCFEQSEYSAHRYLDKNFEVETESVVLDIGAAEGIFALDIADKAKEIYLFECDEEWVEALKCTFTGYDNVHIVNKYVADIDSDNFVTLDSFFNTFANEKLFIKMDIEGAEVRAIKGARNLINQVKNLKIAACAYHRPEHYEELRKLLKGMRLSKSDGYLCPLFGRVSPPYFRVGVLRAVKEEEEKIRD